MTDEPSENGVSAVSEERQELNREIRNCTKCPLYENRTQAVPNQGSEDSEVMFAGKMVGYPDDQVGLPYQGQAGKTIDYVLEKNGLTRDDVYLTNLTRCYPPESRNPTSEELDRCMQYFERELSIVDPDYIVALGRLTAQRLLGRDVSVNESHGEMFGYRTLTFQAEVLVTYNVGAVQYDRSKRTIILEDVSPVLEEVSPG
ncbi:MAG: uracil-DNA glycosylase family protein [Halobacteria archaeon]